MKRTKPTHICPKCKGTRWKTKSKKDRKYQCRGCGHVQLDGRAIIEKAVIDKEARASAEVY